MIDLLITNAQVVTVNPQREILNDAAIAINDTRILAIGPTAQILEQYPEANSRINAAGKVVFPGLINTHNHLFQTLYKGLGDDKVLADWLSEMTFPSSVHLTPEDVYYGAMIGCLEGLRSGTTTMVDYMYPHPRPGLSDGVIKAFQELGLRAIFGRGFMDTGEQFGVQPGIMQDIRQIEADARRLLESYHGKDDGKLQIWLAPAAVWSNSRESLLLTKRLAEEYQTGITVHISETPFDREAARQLHGEWDIDVLEKLGLMGPNLLMVHCVHLTPHDIRMAKYFDAKVSYNPVSNMYLSSGVPPVPRLIEAGVTVGLATDGAASNNSNDMVETLKFAGLLQKVHHLDPTVITAEKILEMATIDGAKALGMEREIGSLEPGKKGDLFIFNPQAHPKAIPLHHPVSTLVYSSSIANVETVVVDGEIILDGGRLRGIDEELILKRAQKVADNLSERAGTAPLKKRPWRTLAY